MAAAAPEAPGRDVAARFEALGYGPDALADFGEWLSLLQRWSRRINLLGPAELARFWGRHAIDSAQLFQIAPAPARWIDLGAGAGFPGLAVAIAQKQAGAAGGETLMVESVGKKASFLREAARALGVPARVEARRYEELEPQPYDVVTARAFAPLPRLFAAASRFWGPSTVGVFPKGKALDEEIAAAEADWRFQAERVRSITGDGVILRVTELESR